MLLPANFLFLNLHFLYLFISISLSFYKNTNTTTNSRKNTHTHTQEHTHAGWPELKHPFSDLPFYRITQYKGLKFCTRVVNKMGIRMREKWISSKNANRWCCIVENMKKKHNNPNKKKMRNENFYFYFYYSRG